MKIKLTILIVMLGMLSTAWAQKTNPVKVQKDTSEAKKGYPTKAQKDSIAVALKTKSPTVQFLYKRGYTFHPPRDTVNGGEQKWPDTLYYNTVYKSRLLGTPTIPISFSRLEKVNGVYQVSPVVSLGYGYAWFWGDFIFNETDKIDVDSKVFFGVLGDFGLEENLSLNKLGSFFTGGFVGFAAYSLFFGYDYITHSPTYGLGARIDVYTIWQNTLRPFGKVREFRKHKTGAVRIEDE